MPESAATMIVHGLVLGAVLYMAMRHALGQAHKVAMDRSAVIGLLAAVYMILFGHAVPPARLSASFR